MRKQEQEKEYKNLEKAEQEINGVIEEDVTENGEPEEPLGKVSALFSFIVYFISYMIGFVVYLRGIGNYYENDFQCFQK